MRVHFLTIKLLVLFSTAFLFASTTALAYHDNEKDSRNHDKDCPLGFYNDIPLDVEFGPGTQDATHCLQKRHDAKVVVAIDSAHPSDKNGVTKKDKATFLSNVDLMIANYEHVHGMKIGKYIKIVVVASASGGLLMTKRHKAWGIDSLGNPMPNSFAAFVQKGIAAGIEFYLCQIAARELVSCPLNSFRYKS